MLREFPREKMNFWVALGGFGWLWVSWETGKVSDPVEDARGPKEGALGSSVPSFFLLHLVIRSGLLLLGPRFLLRGRASCSEW